MHVLGSRITKKYPDRDPHNASEATIAQGRICIIEVETSPFLTHCQSSSKSHNRLLSNLHTIIIQDPK